MNIANRFANTIKRNFPEYPVKITNDMETWRVVVTESERQFARSLLTITVDSCGRINVRGPYGSTFHDLDNKSIERGVAEALRRLNIKV